MFMNIIQTNIDFFTSRLNDLPARVMEFKSSTTDYVYVEDVNDNDILRVELDFYMTANNLRKLLKSFGKEYYNES